MVLFEIFHNHGVLSIIIFLESRLSTALYGGVGKMSFPGKLTIDIVSLGWVPSFQEAGMRTHLR